MLVIGIFVIIGYLLLFLEKIFWVFGLIKYLRNLIVFFLFGVFLIILLLLILIWVLCLFWFGKNILILFVIVWFFGLEDFFKCVK